MVEITGAAWFVWALIAIGVMFLCGLATVIASTMASEAPEVELVVSEEAYDEIAFALRQAGWGSRVQPDGINTKHLVLVKGGPRE